MIKINIYYNQAGSCMVAVKHASYRKKSFPYDYYYGNKDNAIRAMQEYCKLHGLPTHTIQGNTITGDYVAIQEA